MLHFLFKYAKMHAFVNMESYIVDHFAYYLKPQIFTEKLYQLLILCNSSIIDIQHKVFLETVPQSRNYMLQGLWM